MQKHILIVEDEPAIRDMVAFALRKAGMEAMHTVDARAAQNAIGERIPDLILVDWMLPGMSGIELARRLRRDELTADLPLIMLTARGEESDKLRSFDSGVDDYVTKPFSPRELIARIKALIRRSGAPADGRLVAHGIALDSQSHRLSINGEPVHIGPTEFRLLEFLMRHPDRAFDRTQLLDRVWGRSVYVEERTVDVHILRLRKVLAPHGLGGLVQTVRGIGYRFSERA